VAWSPDGKYIAAPYDDETPALWDAQTGRKIRTFSTRKTKGEDIEGMAWSPNGRHLAVADEGGNVRAWDTQAEDRCRILMKLMRETTRSSPTSRSRRPTSRGRSYSRSKRPRGTSAPSASFGRSGSSYSVSLGHVAWHPDGKYLAIEADNGNLYLCDTTRTISGRPPRWPFLPGGETPGVWSPKNCEMATTYGNGIVCVWDVSNAHKPKPVRLLKPGQYEGANETVLNELGRLYGASISTLESLRYQYIGVTS